ncbi:MAG: UDP-N-acetylglucosamine 2-epimerase (non-hydrolyzing) [Candidatus Omnitrophica bacterium]|nr:UDP-N-acetylglucosamine 2-epimerase (non-hydrolyzing) [Candidatus Omnitrophota bacterium]MCM8831981.1 UDP-N-acetylglucosamine 2-epimerase (non-hydrolyzing) [Candidatus Omnitrophota bacterium]
MKKIMVVCGTRPEVIKLAPVIKELQKYPERFRVFICATAQHRQMLDDMLNLFKIKPHYDLNIMKEKQSIFEVTTKCLTGIKGIIEKERPDILLVQGDTTTTFATSLASFYLKIPVGHIEAGLRTNDKFRPFPEEINRRLTSHLADFHFVPTKRAQDNLLAEGIQREHIFLTGNTVIDALFYILKVVEKNKNKLNKRFSFLNPKRNKLILVTAHRRENFGKPLENVCLALKRIVEKNKNVEIIYPVHPNPHVFQPVREILKGIERIYLIKPLDYIVFVYLLTKSYLVLTDSGGIQEEAPSLGKPVLVMREKTERPEAIEAGVAMLVGTGKRSIVENVEMLLDSRDVYRKMSQAVNPFGDGKASQRIVKILNKIKIKGTGYF